jgi:predicted Rossmann fold nucleotide-binding protein DprA/Smf involved in DNA uptake
MSKPHAFMVKPADTHWTHKIGSRFGDDAPAQLTALGNIDLLALPKVALFCSTRCPGQLILETYDLAQRFREEGIPVISGFHSPMEQECLRILLRAPQSVIWCLARGLFRRVPVKPVDCRSAVTAGHLAIVSPFPDKLRQPTTQTALVRNRLVAELAAVVVVAHAAPGSKSETLCRELLAAGKPLYTFDAPAHAALLQAGARPITPETDWKRLLTRPHEPLPDAAPVPWHHRAAPSRPVRRRHRPQYDQFKG